MVKLFREGFTTNNINTLRNDYVAALEGPLSADNLKNSTEKMNLLFDGTYQEYGGRPTVGGGDERLYLEDNYPPDAYFTTSESKTAITDVNDAQKRLKGMQGAFGDERGIRDVSELQLKANRFHYFSFFIIFIIIVIYTLRVFTSNKNNTVETLILVAGSLIILYFLVHYIVEYFRNKT